MASEGFRGFVQKSASGIDEATHSGDSGSNEILREKNPAAVALGRLGGKKGGPSRAMRLSGTRRSEIARLAAQKRWATKIDATEE